MDPGIRGLERQSKADPYDKQAGFAFARALERSGLIEESFCVLDRFYAVEREELLPKLLIDFPRYHQALVTKDLFHEYAISRRELLALERIARDILYLAALEK